MRAEESKLRSIYRKLREMIDDVEDPVKLPTPSNLVDDPGVSFDPTTGEICAGMTVNFGPVAYDEPGADVRYVMVTRHADGRYEEDWYVA